MKLFVWDEDVLTNYGDGIAIAIAETEEQARELLLEAGVRSITENGLDKPPDHVHDLTEPVAYWLYGTS